MQEHHAAVYRTARYWTLGPAAEAVRELWMVCHGYGQLAASFLRSFHAVDAPGRLIVAPEGLSRFYLAGHERVGASWMTKEARETEITDYVRWLDTAYTDALTQAHAPLPERTVAFGFSQGCATVVRWLAESPVLGDPPCDRLVLWGGSLPHDLDLERHRDWLGRVNLTLVVGDADTYATPERVAEQEARLREHAIAFETLRFTGAHHLDADMLRRLADM